MHFFCERLYVTLMGSRAARYHICWCTQSFSCLLFSLFLSYLCLKSIVLFGSVYFYKLLSIYTSFIIHTRVIHKFSCSCYFSSTCPFVNRSVWCTHSAFTVFIICDYSLPQISNLPSIPRKVRTLPHLSASCHVTVPRPDCCDKAWQPGLKASLSRPQKHWRGE